MCLTRMKFGYSQQECVKNLCITVNTKIRLKCSASNVFVTTLPHMPMSSSYPALCDACKCFNPLESRCNYSATSNNIKLVHWPLMGELLHLVQPGRDWAGPQPAQAPPRSVPNVTAHPSTASVPITTLLYSGPLLYDFNAPNQRCQ